MRKLASIREISDIRPISGADRIEVAQVDGWECVVQKGEFHVGQHIVYIEVDSIVPEVPEFEFLRARKFRVRTIKLRGQVSQGLVLPLTILPDGAPRNLGDDVTEILHITKYDPEAQQEAMLVNQQKKSTNLIVKYLMRFAWFRKIFAKPKRKGGFPDWIVKTDETRIQNLPVLFEAERDKGTEFSITEKMDGQSATYFLNRISKRKFEFGVCSRNIRLVEPDNSSYWTVAKKYDIENVLKKTKLWFYKEKSAVTRFRGTNITLVVMSFLLLTSFIQTTNATLMKSQTSSIHMGLKPCQSLKMVRFCLKLSQNL